jgi:serine O-acetyltransferase
MVMLQTTLNQIDLTNYLTSQLNNFFPDGRSCENLNSVLQHALAKLEHCFSFVNLSYYSKDGHPYYNHLNADHNTVLLYFSSNIAYKINDIPLASKLFYLNKTLHSFHCMYDTILPEIFLVIHGVGTILGKATYSSYFVVTQGCTIGTSANEAPKIGAGAIMYPNSSIVGKSVLRENCCIANGAFVSNYESQANELIIGQSPDLKIKSNRADRLDYFFKNYKMEMPHE